MFDFAEIPDSQRLRMQAASRWFAELQQIICGRFEELERANGLASGHAGIVNAATRRHAGEGEDCGGGIMATIKHGAVFEKAGINFSEVFGTLDESAQRSLTASKGLPDLDRDPRFWASGISVVGHMQNPFVPAVHFNTRMFWTPQRSWFGGGSDLNPCLEFQDDNRHFHSALERCCNRHDPEYYPRFKEWADSYFFIRHRRRARGAGGVFFDDLKSGDWEADFSFVKDLGQTFLEAFLPVVERRLDTVWTERDRETQLVHRGLYVEFNLLYDRGTRFGLATGHDPDAVLMSLPPLARWP